MSIETLERRFSSGNAVPVERTQITAEEWASIKADRAALAAAVVALVNALTTVRWGYPPGLAEEALRDHAPAIALAREMMK